jgi:hypothetical protein
VGTRELGRPLAVDEESLADPNGPVLMTVGCRTPIQLPDFVMLFVNMEGFRVRVVHDGGVASTIDVPPPPPPKPALDGDDDDAADSDADRWDGPRGRHNNKDPQCQISQKQGKAGGPSRKSAGATEKETATNLPGSSKLLPDTAFSQYGFNLTEGGYLPTSCKIMSPMTKEQPSDVDSIQESDQPPISLSATELCSPGGIHETGQSYITPGKAKSLSDKEKEEVGWESPEPSKEDAIILRDMERRSKSNHDRPSKILSSSISAVASHLEFSDESCLKQKDLLGAKLQKGLVVPELSASVARAPRSRASPVEAARKSARGQC